jgi:hypothetical protein
MSDERPSDDWKDGMINELEEAGLLTVGSDAQGRKTWTLTASGAQVATQMPMSSEDDALALLDAARAETSGVEP